MWFNSWLKSFCKEKGVALEWYDNPDSTRTIILSKGSKRLERILKPEEFLRSGGIEFTFAMLIRGMAKEIESMGE